MGRDGERRTRVGSDTGWGWTPAASRGKQIPPAADAMG